MLTNLGSLLCMTPSFQCEVDFFFGSRCQLEITLRDFAMQASIENNSSLSAYFILIECLRDRIRIPFPGKLRHHKCLLMARDMPNLI